MKEVLFQIGRIILLTFSGMIYAMALGMFLDPNNMAPGGVSGVAVIVNRLLEVETGTLILIINIPIMILGIIVFGFKFILTTIYTLLVVSVGTNLLEHVGFVVTEDRMLAAVAGGALMGISLGSTFRLGATTGGTDIIVKVLRRRLQHIKSGQLFLFMDIAVIATSAVVFKDIEVALYAGVAVFISSVVMDRVLYGTGAGKLVYIVSKNHEAISDRLIKELVVGVTYVRGEGAYTGRDKKIILCVVRNYSLPKVRNIVREEDSEAFLFVSPATEVFGEGYKPHDSEEL